MSLAERSRAQGGPAEIVNADAMQLYRGMDIGTAKLPLAERRGIPHHLLDVLEVTDDAAVAWYQEAARVGDRRHPCHGVRMRSSSADRGSTYRACSSTSASRLATSALRRRLEAELERGGARRALRPPARAADPATAARVDPRNGRRIVRALEVLAQGEATHGAALPDAAGALARDTRDHRCDESARGAGRAARRACRADVGGRTPRRGRSTPDDGASNTAPPRGGRSATPRRSRSCAATTTEAEAIAETQALTRRYARRQVSWFTRYRATSVWSHNGRRSVVLLADDWAQ